MPELPFHTNDNRELIKDKWFDMDGEQRTAKMAFSGTRSLLLWCRQQTEGYNEVNVYNMSSSWRDGLAFCAIIHHYRPDLIDFDRLSKENILENNELAFSMAEKHFGIPLVLDASDMIENPNPDRLSIITYVSQLYEYFKNKTPANQGYSTKMNIQPKARSESTGHKGGKRTSPSHQARILTGHAKRVASALRNVFKSDTKEEQSKSKEQGPSSKYLSVDSTRMSFDANRNSEENSPSATKKSPFLGNDCFVCHNRVFLMERLIAERKLFHRACFKCDKCSACLRPGTYHYCPETDRFCCLFDCTGAQRKKPITIKFEPLTDVSQEPHTQQNLSPKSSPDLSNRNTAKPTDSDEKVKSPLQRQFSVVKKNAITLPALPAISQRKASASKSPKSPRSSNKSKTSQGQKGEGQKKRRFSAGRRVKGKLERTPKVKSVDTAEPGELEKTWSPLNKRRAPDTNLVEKSNNVENNDGDNVTNEISHEDAPRVVSMSMSSTKSDFLSDEEQEEGKQTDLQNNDQKRTPKEAPANLFFSFKEELLKRATESNTTEENKLLNGCEHKPSNDKTALDVDGKEKGESENDLKLDGGNDLNWDKDNERKCSEDTSSVNSDSTKSMGSQKTSMSDEIERPVAPKSVQRLRQKFLNIDDMIDEKHKNNLARKTHEIQRELRCISAWKQQTDSHVATSRKLSIHSAGKSVESKKPNLGGSRRSVKELRKMYMEGGKAGKRKLFAESLASRERRSSEPERTDTTADNVEEKCDSNEAENEDHSASCKDVDKSLQTDNADEPSANKNIDNSSTTMDDNNSCQSNHVDNSPESEDVEDTFSQSRSVVNLSQLRDVVGVEEDTRNDSNEPCDEANHTVVINIEHNEGKIDSYSDANNNESQPSSDNVRGLSNETRTFTIINSDDVSHEVPSLHIEPASPQSSNGDSRRSPGLKRHAASHDSGIDMPSYMQSNLLGSSPDDKTSGGNLKVAAEFSFPGSGTTVLTPSEQFSNETGTDVQVSNPPLSPGSEGSPEVLWSLPLSTGNRSSLTDSSSSCSSPRMSIIIAQEASTTKINSRFFTVETMEPWDFENHRIAEEHQCVMEVEGEFSFGREKSKTSRAEREAIFSLRGDARSGNFNSTDLIKEEEITLSPSEIDSELQSLDALHRELERRGVEIEHSLRECMQCERPFNDCEDELLREWLSVVHERNMILRRESELIYLLQSHNYEERYRTVEGELRKLVAMRDEVKSSDDLKRERELLSELLELVQKRSFIVDSLEEERVREIHEDEKVEQALTDGIAALPNNRWSQRPDCTKVAFSRFYC